MMQSRSKSKAKSVRFLFALLAAMTLLALPATVDAARRSRQVVTYAVAVSIECRDIGPWAQECDITQVEAYDTVYGDAVCVTIGTFVDGPPPDEQRVESGCVDVDAANLRVDARFDRGKLRTTAVPVHAVVCRFDTGECERNVVPRTVNVAAAWDGVGALNRFSFGFFGEFGPCTFAMRGLDVNREASATIWLNGSTESAEFGILGRGYESLNFFNDCMRGMPTGR